MIRISMKYCVSKYLKNMLLILLNIQIFYSWNTKWININSRQKNIIKFFLIAYNKLLWKCFVYLVSIIKILVFIKGVKTFKNRNFKHIAPLLWVCMHLHTNVCKILNPKIIYYLSVYLNSGKKIPKCLCMVSSFVVF